MHFHYTALLQMLNNNMLVCSCMKLSLLHGQKSTENILLWIQSTYLVIQFSERINQNKNWCNETVRISRRPHSAGVKPTMHGSHVQHRSVGSHSFIMSVGSEKSGLIWGMHINYEIAPEKYQRGE